MSVSNENGSAVEFLYLSQEDVIAAGGADMSAAICDLELVHVLIADREVIEPTALVLPLSDVSGHRLVAHAAWVGGEVRTGGLKWIPASPENLTARRGIPRATGVLVLTEPETGLPMAVMDGTLINAVRTAASTSVAIRHLARPDARVVGLVGAGASNQAQPAGLEIVAPRVEEIRVFDTDDSRARHLQQTANAQTRFKVEVAASAEEAVRGSDIIITATLGVEPSDAYITEDWVKEGALVCAVSFNDTSWEVICNAKAVVTSQLHEFDMPSTRLGALLESGRLKRDVCLELGSVIKGSETARSSDEDIIYYSLYGFGAFDTVVGRRIYERARELEVGQQLRLWEAPHWI